MPYRKEQAPSSSPPQADMFADAADAARDARRIEHDRRTRNQARIAKKMISDGYNREHPAHTGTAPDGVCHCGSPLFSGHSGIYKNETGQYYFDHMRCGSWACPVCATKRNHLRQTEIEQALLAAHEAGHKMLFLTFTMPHWSRDTCLKTRRAIQDAYTKMTRRSRLRRVLAEHGYKHAIKCWDFTYGDNGWHPHIHAIWFFESDEDVYDLSVAIQGIVMEQWGLQVKTTANRTVSRRHGFLCEPVYMESDEGDSAEKLACYCAKKVSAYATDVDKSGEESRTPFSFLVPENHPLYQKNSRIFYDYYKGQKGIRRIRMSPGFREDYGIDEARHERPVQNKIASTHQHHILFLADGDNFARFSEIGRQFGDDAALDWLDEAAARDYVEGLLDGDFRHADYYRSQFESRPEMWALSRRSYVIDFLAGRHEDACEMPLYADRARYLSEVEYNRLEAMYAALERSRACDVALVRSHRAYLDRLDALEQLSLSLPPNARPLSGLGRVLGVVEGWGFDSVPASVSFAEEEDDYWF